jgi:hypothetical protein
MMVQGVAQKEKEKEYKESESSGDKAANMR